MFTDISWRQYFIFILFLLIPYYLYILIRYYKVELLQLFTYKWLIVKDRELPDSDLQLFSEDLEDLLEEAAKIRGDKDIIISSLEHLIKNYPSSNDPAIQEKFKKIIFNKCKSSCSIQLEHEELADLWK